MINNPQLIILGKDPQNPSNWLLQCPCCQKVSSVGSCAKWRAVNKDTSVCNPCSKQYYATDIEGIPGQLIIIQQFIVSHRKRTAMALVKCPICYSVFSKSRRTIRQSHRSICRRCSNLKLISNIPNRLTILHQAYDYTENGALRALVMCPDCQEIYPRLRNKITSVCHSFCHSCIHKREKDILNDPIGCYYGIDWFDLSDRIRLRDNNTCQFPGCSATSNSISRKLDVHHIIPYRQSCNGNSEQNLITLCRSHHKWADSCLNESIPMFELIISAKYNGIL